MLGWTCDHNVMRDASALDGYRKRATVAALQLGVHVSTSNGLEKEVYDKILINFVLLTSSTKFETPSLMYSHITRNATHPPNSLLAANLDSPKETA